MFAVIMADRRASLCPRFLTCMEIYMDLDDSDTSEMLRKATISL